MKAKIVFRNTSFIVLVLDSVQVVARGLLVMSLKLGGFSGHTWSRPLLFGHVEGHMGLRLTWRGVREWYGINNRWDQGVASHSLLDGRSMMGFYTIAKESRGGGVHSWVSTGRSPRRRGLWIVTTAQWLLRRIQ